MLQNAVSAWKTDGRQSIFDLLQSWHRSQTLHRYTKIQKRSTSGWDAYPVRTYVYIDSIGFNLIFSLASCFMVGFLALFRRFFQVIKIIYRLSLDASFQLIGFHHFSFLSVYFFRSNTKLVHEFQFDSCFAYPRLDRYGSQNQVPLCVFLFKLFCCVRIKVIIFNGYLFVTLVAIHHYSRAISYDVCFTFSA